jgi:hypothetical protein
LFAIVVVSSLSVPSLFLTKQQEHTLTVIAFNPPPVLFISGALHRNDELWLFLMDLEFWQPGPPKLIMRNYEYPSWYLAQALQSMFLLMQIS